jgi:hypothetical protein
MADDKSFIIDPLTCLCKVALLHFMPEKTKLAISHHVLYIQGYSYYQWLERMKNGDNRIDISNLNTPFLKAIKWYINESQIKVQLDSETSNSIKTITEFTILGLIKLQKCTYYNDLAIKIILQYFINMLSDALNNTWDENKYISTEKNNHNSSVDKNNNILSDKIKLNFEAHTINSIAKMLTDADKFKNSSEDVFALVDCVHQLLINRDTNFVKLMREINTIL